KITAGTLADARIPSLDAAKIATGTLATARIPNLDAAKISSGVLAAARIPSLPISQITGLQSALDSKLNLSGGTMTGALRINAGNQPLTLQSANANQAYIQWRDAANTRTAYFGFASANNTNFTLNNESGHIILTAAGRITANGYDVWTAGNFDP